MGKPIHAFASIEQGLTVCGIRNKWGKFLVTLTNDIRFITCKNCVKHSKRDKNGTL